MNTDDKWRDAIQVACASILLALLVILIGIGLHAAIGRELYPGQYAQVDPATREWYQKQSINPAAQQRMGHAWASCCEHGDVFRTQFRVGENRADEWWYLKDGEWKRIPDDVIHWGEHAPDGRPTLFIYQSTGEELCFYPGEDGN